MTHSCKSSHFATSRVEDLLRREQYAQALEELEVIRRSSDEISDMASIARVFCLHARSLYGLGHLRRALIKIKVADRLAKRAKVDSLYADTRLIYGRILVGLGDLSGAVEAFNESYVFYRRVNDHKSVLLPLDSLAQLHFLTGDLRRSYEVLNLSLECARKHCPSENVSTAMRNLARVCLFMGRCAEAESMLSSIHAPECDRKGLSNLCVLRGLLHLLRMELEPAEQQLKTAFSALDELRARRDADVCLEYLGQLEYCRGNYSKARSYYRRILDASEPTKSAVAQALRMMTEAYVADRKYAEAIATARKAEKAISKMNERMELGALWRAYGQIHTHSGNRETAREYFAGSIDLLQETGARYELALTYFACGRSGSFAEKERLGYLHIARTLFAEMDIPKRAEEVEQAITEPATSAPPSPDARSNADGVPRIVTRDPKMREILATISRIRNTDMTVLITGETGTGKDLLAEYIHRSSARSNGPFRAVNSGAIPETLLESQLFGSVRGSFTGAAEDKMGLIESANGGTFYFDEIGEIPCTIQVKLLRVIEARRVLRVGAASDTHVDVRFIAATNRDLPDSVEKGCFRRDLYYRLQEFPVHLPALRDRLGDIEPLVECFLLEAGFAGVGSDGRRFQRLIRELERRRWPGNIRELRFVINRLCALATERSAAGLLTALRNSEGRVLDKRRPFVEREGLLEVLRRNAGNRSQAARELGIPESTLRYHLKKLEA